MSKGAAAPKTSKVMLEDISYIKVKIYHISYRYMIYQNTKVMLEAARRHRLVMLAGCAQWEIKLGESTSFCHHHCHHHHYHFMCLTFYIIFGHHFIWLTTNLHLMVLIGRQCQFWSNSMNGQSIQNHSYQWMSEVVAINGWTMVWIIIRNIGNANSQ